MDNRAFTLIEITTVIIILAVLLVVGLPAFHKYKSSLAAKQAHKVVAKIIKTARKYAQINEQDYLIVFFPDLRSLAIAKDRDGAYVLVDDRIVLPNNMLFEPLSLPTSVMNNNPILRIEKLSGKCLVLRPIELQFQSSTKRLYIYEYELRII